MVPNTLLSVPFFFLFVAPGALFTLLSKRRRPTAQDSAFLEISRIVLASLAFSGAAFLVLALVRQIHRKWLPEPRGLLGANNAAYFHDRYGLILWTFALGASLACLFAALFDWGLLRLQGGAPIRRRSAWRQALRFDQPDKTDVYARVRLDDDTVYYGLVVDFSAELETDGRELVLGQPMLSGKAGEGLEPVPTRFDRVVIPGDSIKVLSVEYREMASSRAPAAPPGLSRRRPASRPGPRSSSSEPSG